MNGVKQYTRQVPVLWWTAKWKYVYFIMRELTSLCVLFCSLELLYLIYVVSQGETAYNSFVSRLHSPWLVMINCFAFFGLIFHSYTWFNLAPKAMVIKLGRSTVPGRMILLGNYAGWVAITVILIWLLS